MTGAPRVTFAGTPAFAVPCLDALAAREVVIPAVYCRPDRAAGRGRRTRPCAVKARALTLKLPVRQPPDFRDARATRELEDTAADLMVVVAYGLMLPSAVRAAPRRGCVNLHASLLPRWRGAAPIQRAIEAGDRETGITLMQIGETLDAGDVLAAATTPIRRGDTAATLHDRLSTLAARLLDERLDDVLERRLEPVPQDHARATHAAKIRPEEGEIDWRDAAETIARRIRAFDPWPGCRSRLDGETIKIWGATAVETARVKAPPGEVVAVARDAVHVQCGRGILGIVALQKPGGRRLDARQYLNGSPIPAGARFGS